MSFSFASKNVSYETFLTLVLEGPWASKLSRGLSGFCGSQLLRVHLRRESEWKEMNVSCSPSIKSLLSPLLTVCVIG